MPWIAVSADVNQDFYTSMAGVSLPFYLHLFSFFILTILPIGTGISITQLHRAKRELRGREERGRVTEHHHALSSLHRLLHPFFAVSCVVVCIWPVFNQATKTYRLTKASREGGNKKEKTKNSNQINTKNKHELTTTDSFPPPSLYRGNLEARTTGVGL